MYPPPYPPPPSQPPPSQGVSPTATVLIIVVSLVTAWFLIFQPAFRWMGRDCNLPTSMYLAVTQGSPGTFEFCANGEGDIDMPNEVGA